MLRKEPALGLLGLGLKPTTSTLSYIPEGGKEKPRLMSQEQEEEGGGKIKRAKRERVRNERSSHLHNRLQDVEEEEEEKEGVCSAPVTFQPSEERVVQKKIKLN